MSHSFGKQNELKGNTYATVVFHKTKVQLYRPLQQYQMKGRNKTYITVKGEKRIGNQ